VEGIKERDRTKYEGIEVSTNKRDIAEAAGSRVKGAMAGINQALTKRDPKMREIVLDAYVRARWCTNSPKYTWQASRSGRILRL